MSDSLSIFMFSIVFLLLCVTIAVPLGYLIDRVRSVYAAQLPKVHIHRAIKDQK
jgi:hypothetical protein